MRELIEKLKPIRNYFNDIGNTEYNKIITEAIEELETNNSEDKKQHAIGFYFHCEDDEITDKKVAIIDILYRDYLKEINE